MSDDAQWQFWIDRGGTFTDIVARAPDGRLRTHKLLSDNPDHYEDAALQGMRDLLGLAADAPLPAAQLASVKMGTTVATNALLERRGEPVALAVTKGFADVIRIGTQARPEIFALRIDLPDMLYERVIEIDERVCADGTVDIPLDEDRARAALKAVYEDGYRALAICLAHAYRFDEHEKRVAAIAREIGFTQISAGHAVNPLMKFVPRGDTTLVDAYLNPVLRRYIDRLAEPLRGTPLMFMQSNGGLARADHFQGKDAILSGPAGGVVGAVRIAAQAGFDKIIGFDMGGTSTDVCHYKGAYERSYESQIAGVRIRAPMMDIHTVAAGGGSVAAFDKQRFRVGPASAGADPGPACYGKGGPVTVTDCNLILGRLDPSFFPAVFGPDADSPPDRDAARGAMKTLLSAIESGTGRSMTAEEAAEGFLAVAVDNMARAIKRISVEKGHDVTDYALVAFGGAGGQHACAVADALGIGRIVLHPLAGVLSALGIGLADLTAMTEAAVENPLGDAARKTLDATLESLSEKARKTLMDQGVAAEQIETIPRLQIRYRGTDTPLMIDYGEGDAPAIQKAFETVHRRRFGFIDRGKDLIVQSAHVEAVGRSAEPLDAARPQGKSADQAAIPDHRMFREGNWLTAPVYRRGALSAGEDLPGPAIVIDDHGTTVIEKGWSGRLDDTGALILERSAPVRAAIAGETQVDPVRLELFNNLFMSIAEQMGVVLQNTAHSVNMKERLDFSCAVFDGGGDLIANAPHIPVHLGSMSESVKAIIEDNPSMRDGDAFVMNAPYAGGTHLPDITVVMPVFADDADNKARAGPHFYVGARGHHGDIGGQTPGSMPPASTTILDEGVVIDPVKLLSGGEFLEREIREILAGGRYPARNPDQNIADLKAQIAACTLGAGKLRALSEHAGLAVVEAYMGHVQDNAEMAVKRLLETLKDGAFHYEMDCGAVIDVDIAIDRQNQTAHVDFSGTGRQMANNFNAPAAVTRAAVLYVFRTLLQDEIPLNSGCLRPLEIVIPEGSLLNPEWPAAVVAGNVETSQAVVNTLLGALGAQAASQGTMNNLTFGNETYQYYETLCGGTGAGPDFDGASGVHSHMTNSRLTDAEVLEARYPVLVRHFGLRRGSGGNGAHRGGDGVVREIEFREEMTAGILSDNRKSAPFGLRGGEPGKPGRNRVRRADRSEEGLAACDETRMSAGDRLIVETPGGGGFGAP